MILLLSSVTLVVLSATSLVLGLRKNTTRDGPEEPEAFWDENCFCCGAGCGETDGNNVCLICGH